MQLYLQLLIISTFSRTRVPCGFFLNLYVVIRAAHIFKTSKACFSSWCKVITMEVNCKPAKYQNTKVSIIESNRWSFNQNISIFSKMSLLYFRDLVMHETFRSLCPLPGRSHKPQSSNLLWVQGYFEDYKVGIMRFLNPTTMHNKIHSSNSRNFDSRMFFSEIKSKSKSTRRFELYFRLCIRIWKR